MITKPTLLLSTLATLALCACADPSGSPLSDAQAGQAPAAQQAAASRHAAPDVAPGSHADWCAEHQVPESLCTRCNPALVPAFKATGDWCAPHGLPESQCQACNPGLVIERPAPKGEVTP